MIFNQQVPNYAHHTVGVGGFVVNDKDELLVIEERFRFQDKAHWKLPGGKYQLQPFLYLDKRNISL